MSDSLQLYKLQDARLPCASLSPRVFSDSCPLSHGCHPTISFSIIPFSSCPQSFTASGSFQMAPLFPSGGQSIEVSASASILPMNIHDWFPLNWLDLLAVQRTLKSLLQHDISKASILRCSAFWPVYRFLKRQVRWSGILISFRIFHSLLWSTCLCVYHNTLNRL